MAQSKRSKIEYLKGLNENDFTAILYELFSKKFEDVKIIHGPDEFGVDILFCEFREFLKEKTHYGVQVKRKDITLSIANTILSQIEMANNHKFHTSKDSFKLDAIWVITSGKITKNAEQVIYDRFSDKYLAKIIRFFDGEKICELIEQHAPEIFYSEYEKYFAYFSEVNNMLDNISDLKTIGSTKEKKVSELYVSLKVCEEVAEKDR